MTARFGYTGTALPEDTDTEAILDTTAAFSMERAFDLAGIKRIKITLKNSHVGTLNEYRSSDRGTNWEQVDSTAVTVPAFAQSFEYLVEGMDDWKLEWVNQVTQTTFNITIAGLDDRALGS